VGQIAKAKILDAAAGGVKKQKTAGTAVREGLLCDQFRRDFIMKIASLHRPHGSKFDSPMQ
jgi:hypothetical protein